MVVRASSAVFVLGILVLFASCPAWAEVEGIDIIQWKEHHDGVADPAFPYGVDIRVYGSDLTSAKVETPDGSEHFLAGDSQMLSLDMEFATEAELLNAFGSGTYAFTINDSDYVSIPYAVSPPSGFAQILSFDDNETGVTTNPIYQWTSVDGIADALHVEVARQIVWETIYEDTLFDTTATTWQPGELDLNTWYSLSVSTATLQGGSPQPMQTAGSDDFVFLGVWSYDNEIRFCTIGHDIIIDELFFVKYAEQGGDTGQNPFGVSISAGGSNLLDATLETPDGTVHTMIRDGDDCDLDLSYPTLEDLNTAFPAGQYTFTFNGGADSLVVDHTVSIPAEFPVITNVPDGAQNVGKNPVYQWEAVAGADCLALFVADSLQDEDIYEQWPVALSETTWQPGALDPATDYNLQVAAANMQGGAIGQLQTQQGQTVIYVGVFTRESNARFTTAVTLPTIDELFFVKYAAQGGDTGQNPFGVRFGVRIDLTGADLLDATLETPDGVIHTLACDGDDCEIEISFAALADLNTAFPAGQYVFTFNGGLDSLVVDHTVSAPAAFPVITNVPDGAQNVGKNPIYEWEAVTGADGLALFVWDCMEYEESYEQWPVDLIETTWQPGTLDPATDYNLQVAAANMQGTAIQQVQTQQGQTVSYVGVFTRESNARFATAPMPDINGLSICIARNLLGGVDLPLPWEMSVNAFGTSITDVSVLAPSGGDYQLFDDGEEWELDEAVEDYATLAELNAAFGTGNYVYTFNGGFDSVTVAYNTPMPTGFANVTNPEHGSTGNPEVLAFQWESTAAFGDLLEVELNGPAGTVYGEEWLDINDVAWEPGPLDPSTAYSFEISMLVYQADSREMQTDTGDTFYWQGEAEICNEVQFDTIPASPRRLDGDANDDCKVNILDMIAIRNHLNQDPKSGDNWWYDVNDDGKINILDLIYVRNRLNTFCED